MDETRQGWLCGFIGMLIFSGSLPATRAAVHGFDPIFLTAARAVLAAAAAALPLLAFRQKRPEQGDLAPLAIVAACVVVGFPLLSGLAMRHMPSARGILFTGLLPLATALFGVARGGERPRAPFWLFAVLGAAVVAGFALAQGGGAMGRGDILMLVAILVCGLGYAEGAMLSRRLGGWQVICWALVLAAPMMALTAMATWPHGWGGIGGPAWAGLAYVSLFSMLIGFVFWYRGLALGGIAAVGQLQLLQPFFGLLLAAGLLHEKVSPLMVATTLAVVACVAGARKFAR